MSRPKGQSKYSPEEKSTSHMQIRCMYLSTSCSLSYCTKLPAHARIATIFLFVIALQAELAEQNPGVRLNSYSHSGLMQAADLELKELKPISH